MFTPLMALVSNDMLLRTVVREPGVIVGPIAKLLGWICNICFNIVYSITPMMSLGITIIIFTILIKLLLVPLSINSQKSMIKTQELQPKLQALQDKYANSKNDPEAQQKMSMEMSALYRENKVNPFSGCLPLLIQMPILFALYYVIQQPQVYIDVIGNVINGIDGMRDTITTLLSTSCLDLGVLNAEAMDISQLPEVIKPQIEFLYNVLMQQEVYGVNLLTTEGLKTALDTLSVADLQTFVSTFYSSNAELMKIGELILTRDEIYNFFFLNLIESPGWRGVGIIVPVLTWLTTYLQYKVSMSRSNSSAGNEMMQQQQKMMMMIFPIMMALMSINLPSGLGLYWNVSNVLAMLQQIIINKMFMKKKEALEGDN